MVAVKPDANVHIVPASTYAEARDRMEKHLTDAPGTPVIGWTPGTTRNFADGIVLDLKMIDPAAKFLYIVITRA